MKMIAILFLSIFTIHLHAQELTKETEKEITTFVESEMLSLKALDLKAYFKNFSKSNFIQMFEDENIDKKRLLDMSKNYLKKRDNERREQMIDMPDDEFLGYFSLSILTVGDLQDANKMAFIEEQFGRDITEIWNPSINFSKDRYLVFMLPNIDPNTSTPRFGELMLLQIVEKNKNKWEVYSSYQ